MKEQSLFERVEAGQGAAPRVLDLHPAIPFRSWWEVVVAAEQRLELGEPGLCEETGPQLASQRVLRDLNASRSGGVSAP